MAIDSQFIGYWIDENGVNQLALDPQSGDGFWYLAGASPSRYAVPNSSTFHFPLNPLRVWTRVGASSIATIVGHWRHDSTDPTGQNDIGENMIFGPDGRYIDIADGDSIYYSGNYSVSEDSAGKHLLTHEYRSRMQTVGNQYTSTRYDGNVEVGHFVFGKNSAGKDIVTLTPVSPPSTPSVLTRQ